MVLLKTVLTFIICNIPLLPSLIHIVSISGGSFQQMSSINSSISGEIDSQNQLQLSGINILTPGPVQGQSPLFPVAPFVPQPLGSPTTAPISHLPPSPGQLPMGSPIQNSKYLITSNSLPVLGERQNNLILQDGNLSLNSHNSSSWSSGFTGALQDNSFNLSRDRKPSPSPESAPKVSQSSTSNEFQQLFCVARDIAENTYFLLSSFLMSDKSKILRSLIGL